MPQPCSLFELILNESKLYEKQGQVKKIRRLLLDSYKPEVFEGQVKLFSAAARRPSKRNYSMEPWKQIITGPLEVVPIPGDHMSALHPPYVTDLAKKIESLLPHMENAR
jgi:thioesterase domain-containing protein